MNLNTKLYRSRRRGHHFTNLSTILKHEFMENLMICDVILIIILLTDLTGGFNNIFKQ